MYKLMCSLKVIQDNIRILHRNLKGSNWYGTHEVLEDYYEAIDDIADDVIEIGIMLGIVEPNLSMAVDEYKPFLTSRKYTEVEAYRLLYKMFMDVVELVEQAKPNLADDISSKLEEYQFYCRKEAMFKIKGRLTD